MKEKVVSIIYQALDEVNQLNDLNLEKNVNTALYGKNSVLDSLGLVNLIVSIEESINETFDCSISIADEKAMSQKHSPFRSVDTLSDYVVLLINEEKNG